MVKNCDNIYLFAGWEVRMVKNCDRGLENAARSVPLFCSYHILTSSVIYY